MATVSVDEAIERIGVGRFQLPVLVATGLTWSGDAMEMSVMAYVLPALRCSWGVSQFAADSFASVVFFGMLLGALGWGLLSDAVGRRIGWLSTTALTAVAGLLSAAAPDGAVVPFLVARALVGVGLAGTNLGFALSSELLPRAARGTFLMLFELFFVGGSVLEVLLAWALLDGAAGWRWVLALSTLPLWLALALMGHVPESPRWLAGRGAAGGRRAIALLRRAATANGRPEPLAPDDELSCGVGAVVWTSTAEDSRAEEGEAGQEDERSPPPPRDSPTAAAAACDGQRVDASSSSSSPSHDTSAGRSRTSAVGDAVGGARLRARHVLDTIFHPQLRAVSVALCMAWATAWFTYFGLSARRRDLEPRTRAAARPPSLPPLCPLSAPSLPPLCPLSAPPLPSCRAHTVQGTHTSATSVRCATLRRARSGGAWSRSAVAVLLTPKILSAALPPALSHNNLTVVVGAAGGEGETGGGAQCSGANRGGGGGGGSAYIFGTTLLSTLAEVPGLLFATRCVHRQGRVAACVMCLIVAAAALLAVALGHVIGRTASHWGAATTSLAIGAQLVLVAICRMAAFGGFSALYVLTAETFPTRLRATAFGVVSVASRFAGTLTPFVAGSVWDASPAAALFAYSAAAAACAAILRLFVDDTGCRPMPDELASLRTDQRV